MKTLKRFAIFREMKLSKSNIFSKESFSYISENGKPGKNYLYFKRTELSYISGNGTFLYFLKGVFLKFQETYIQNPSIFRNRGIFKTLVYSEPEAYHINVKHLRWNVLQKIATWSTLRLQPSKFFPKKLTLKNFLKFRVT